MAAERRIVLTGIKGTLTLRERDGILTALLPEAPESVLFLVKPSGGLLRLSLHCGQGSIPLPARISLPEAVLVEQNGRMAAHGGFAGRKMLLSEAQRSARLLLWEEETRPKPTAPEMQQPAAAKRAPSAAPPDTSFIASPPPPAGKAAGPAAPEATTAKKLQLKHPLSLPPGEDAPPLRETSQKGSVSSAPPPQASSSSTCPFEANAPYSEAGKHILEQAAKLFHPASPTPPPPRLDPFPKVFPGAVWRRVEYPGTGRYYLEGRYAMREARFLIYALPGEYSPVPPRFLRGYTRFVRGTDGVGYWVRSKRLR